MRVDLSCLSAGDRVLCAVSGGADSMCLLHVMKACSVTLGIEVFAAHYEHGIRGEESERDAIFVSSCCEKYGISCTVGHGDVPAYAKAKGLGTEEAARELRYAFLERTADELGCGYIATAHNANDNVETVLFDLARGSGAKGLAGIPPARGRIIRPLLAVTRPEIERYLEENAISHVEDSTNAQDDYSRNLIRHRVIPVLKQINPALEQALSRSSALLRQDDDCLEALAKSFIERYYDGESLPLDKLRAEHRAVSSRVIRALCEKSLSADNIDAVLALLEGDGLAYADVPGQRLRRERGRLYFSEDEAIEPWDELVIPGESVYIERAGISVSAHFGKNCKEINSQFTSYAVKYESIRGKLHCTQKREGDVFKPAHRGCTKALKKLFAEKKYTRHLRSVTAVFRDDEGIVAVEGFGVAERCAAGAGENVLIITIERK